MDRIRIDALAAAHAHLRLSIYATERLAAVSPMQAAVLRIKDLGKDSPWVDAAVGENSLSGLPRRCVEAAEYLVALVRGDDPIDPRRVALVLQTVAGDAITFSRGARRFAEVHGVTLAEWVRDEHGYHDIKRHVEISADRIAGLR